MKFIIDIWENIFYVKPFCSKVQAFSKNVESLCWITADDDKNLTIFVVAEGKMLEITQKYGEQLEVNIFEVSENGLKGWKDRKNKILGLKKHGELHFAKDLIQGIDVQMKRYKKFTELSFDETIEIYRHITSFQKTYYKDNSLEIHYSTAYGKQNHWLD